MSDRPPQTPPSIGFITVVQEPNGLLGGYLLTNSWGRPLEFRMTTAVQPNRVQQILYGATLDEYLHADLIGKTLIEKTSILPQLVVTDNVSMLAIGSRIDIPVICVTNDKVSEQFAPPFRHPRASLPIIVARGHSYDQNAIIGLLNQIDQALDLVEPFARVREALVEARSSGVANRAA